MPLIVVAGVSGNLGERIARALLARGATVRGLVRKSTPADRRAHLKALGLELANLDFTSVAAAAEACRGAQCVVSALAGLRGVVLDAQTVLLDGDRGCGCCPVAAS